MITEQVIQLFSAYSKYMNDAEQHENGDRLEFADWLKKQPVIHTAPNQAIPFGKWVAENGWQIGDDGFWFREIEDELTPNALKDYTDEMVWNIFSDRQMKKLKANAADAFEIDESLFVYKGQRYVFEQKHGTKILSIETGLPLELKKGDEVKIVFDSEGAEIIRNEI